MHFNALGEKLILASLICRRRHPFLHIKFYEIKLFPPPCTAPRTVGGGLMGGKGGERRNLCKKGDQDVEERKRRDAAERRQKHQQKATTKFFRARNIAQCGRNIALVRRAALQHRHHACTVSHAADCWYAGKHKTDENSERFLVRNNQFNIRGRIC